QAGDWERPIPFTQPIVPPFPADALPGWIQTYVIGLADETQTPVDLAAMLALGALAAVLQKRIEVDVRAGWWEPVNLYPVIPIEPAARKSAVVRDISAPIEEYELECVMNGARERARARSEYHSLEARVRQLQEQAARAKDEDSYKEKRD